MPKFRPFGTIFTVPPETVTAAAADLVVSVSDVAVRLTVATGSVDGAVKVVGVPLGVVEGEAVPHVEQLALLRTVVHVVPALAGSFATVAVNC